MDCFSNASTLCSIIALDRRLGLAEYRIIQAGPSEKIMPAIVSITPFQPAAAGGSTNTPRTVDVVVAAPSVSRILNTPLVVVAVTVCASAASVTAEPTAVSATVAVEVVSENRVFRHPDRRTGPCPRGGPITIYGSVLTLAPALCQYAGGQHRRCPGSSAPSLRSGRPDIRTAPRPSRADMLL